MSWCASDSPTHLMTPSPPPSPSQTGPHIVRREWYRLDLHLRFVDETSRVMSPALRRCVAATAASVLRLMTPSLSVTTAVIARPLSPGRATRGTPQPRVRLWARQMRGLATRGAARGQSAHPATPTDVALPMPVDGSWISDAAFVLSDIDVNALNAEISRLNRTTGAELAVVCLQDLEPPPGDCVARYAAFARGLFDLWGVGRCGVDDGVLLVLFRAGRRVEVITGRGVVHALPDEWLFAMQREEMVPHFKAGDHGTGVQRGVRALISRLQSAHSDPGTGGSHARLPVSGAVPGAAAVPTGTGFGGGRAVALSDVGGREDSGGGGGRGGGASGGVGMAVLFGCGLMALVLGHRLSEEAERRRRRRCTSCPESAKVDMVALTGDADCARLDAQLTPCGRVERRLGAVSYALLRCPVCGAERVLCEPGRGYSTCAHCECRAVGTRTVSHDAPTYDSEGREEVQTSCHFCHRQEHRVQVLPRKSRPSSASASSSSSAGGSSFGGGGSSGGGGAGTSW